MEQEFDEIANGMLKWTDMIREFYDPFHKNVEDTLENSERASGERELGFHPVSGKRIIVRIGRFGPMAKNRNLLRCKKTNQLETFHWRML